MGLRESVSSVVTIQLTIAVFVLLSTAIIIWLLPLLFANRLGAETNVTRWVVALLGTGLAVQMAFDSSRGIMTGCHRWGLHNGIHAGSHAVSVAMMITVLISGGGLISLGLVNLSVIIVTEIFRTFLAYRICSELEVKLSYVTWSRVKEMYLFGAKTIVAGMPQFLAVQVTNIVVVSVLGPAALAVFSRPVALVRHVETFINKFAFVLTPVASSLQGADKTNELREFFFDSTRYGIAFTLPIVIFLVLFGDFILYLWMGQKYMQGTVLAILAIGYFLPISQNSVLRILMGLNLHGRISLINLSVTFVVFIVGLLIISKIGWTISLAATIVAVSLTVGNGMLVPFLACSRLDIPLTEYFRKVFLVPVACGTVFAVWLIVIRFIFSDNQLMATVSALLGGSILMAGLYYSYLLPISIRTKIAYKIDHIFGLLRINNAKKS
jgi:O-antigen/teichoic acid export membrane protein